MLKGDSDMRDLCDCNSLVGIIKDDSKLPYNTYSKDEADNKFASHADTAEHFETIREMLVALTEAVNNKASQSTVDTLTTILNDKASQNTVDTVINRLNDKASQSTVDTVIALLSEKASQSDLANLRLIVDSKADKSDLEKLAEIVDIIKSEQKIKVYFQEEEPDDTNCFWFKPVKHEVQPFIATFELNEDTSKSNILTEINGKDYAVENAVDSPEELTVGKYNFEILK